MPIHRLGDKMKAIDIQSKDLIVVDENTNIWEVAKLMKEKDIGFIPVSCENKIIGVITDRDIVCNAIANKSDLKKTIKDYFTKKVISVSEDDNVSKILNTMRKNKVKRVLVQDNNKKLTGIISFSDILNNNEFDLLNTMKEIWSIKRNSNEYRTEIDEFYL